MKASLAKNALNLDISEIGNLQVDGFLTHGRKQLECDFDRCADFRWSWCQLMPCLHVAIERGGRNSSVEGQFLVLLEIAYPHHSKREKAYKNKKVKFTFKSGN